jgi:DUF2970 family protein
MSAANDKPEPPEKKPNILQIIGSVLAAFFGVQNSKNRERDFKHGNHRHFIITGIVVTVVFILSVYALVQLVLKQAGI